MKKTLYLMRHGQTIFNIRRKIQGSCDSPLTAEGIRQAKIASQYFKDRNISFDYAYSSTSERACDTLELVVDMPYERVKGLKEHGFGTFEGESEDLHPPRDPKLAFKDHYVKFGGEDSRQVGKRMNKALTEIMERDNHHSVLAVSHRGCSIRFLSEWMDIEGITFEMNNCCILKLEYENKTFKLIEAIDHEF